MPTNVRAQPMRVNQGDGHRPSAASHDETLSRAIGFYVGWPTPTVLFYAKAAAWAGTLAPHLWPASNNERRARDAHAVFVLGLASVLLEGQRLREAAGRDHWLLSRTCNGLVLPSTNPNAINAAGRMGLQLRSFSVRSGARSPQRR